MQYKDYYATLGIERDATPEAIKRAYRKLARKYHPDVSEERDAEERFKEVQEAYEVLKDPDKRQAYDRLGRDWRQGEDFAPPPGWQPDAGAGFHDARDFSDFFAAIFGDGGVRQRAQRGGFQLRGQDLHVKVHVALEDAYAGRTRSFAFAVPEIDAHGETRRERKAINVAIPRGITAGQRIRLAGQGGAGFGGGPPGDLFLEVEFDPHPLFQVEGRDVYLELRLAPWEAALGAKVKVPTLGGTVELSIPAGTQSGRRLRLQGRGLPGTPPGDQYAVVSIVVPEARTEADRALYREMERLMPIAPRAGLGV
jgi:curved DNA-binding protein